MQSFTFETTPKIHCEPGSSERLADFLPEDAHRVVLITDGGLLQTGLLEPVLAALEGADKSVEVYTDVMADPPQERVEQAIQFARDAEADAIIGFGGGSSMDTAKLVALLCHSSQCLEDVYGIGLARGKRLPLIQVPTTAGTGSEVTPIAIVTTPSHEKKGVVSPMLYPDVAVLDAHTTLSLPAAVTAMTGIDAMVHCTEAYTSKIKKNPMSDALALKGLGLLYRNLPAVLEQPEHVDSRSAMLLGSCLAGMAFANAPVAAVHALAYPLGGHFHMAHGHSNAVVLGPVLEYNAPEAQREYAELAHYLWPETRGLSQGGACEHFVHHMSALVRDMPFEQRLSDMGVEEKHLDTLADDAMKIERLLVNNPREMTRQAAYDIYQSIL
ncbi:MAG: iron-containing alcohol dehydrogenase [Pseudomonadota bacterium]